MKLKEITDLDQQKELTTTEQGSTTEFYNVLCSNVVKNSYAAIGGLYHFGEIGNIKNPRSRSYLVYNDNESTDDVKRIDAYNNEELKFSIAFCDFSKLFQADNNKGLMKIYVFVLIKIYEMCFYNGEFISIPGKTLCAPIKYSDMVEAGLYQSEIAARTGLKKNVVKLANMKFSAELNTKDKAFIPLFKAILPQKGGYDFVPNDAIDWNAIAEFYTKVPKWAFKLSSKAFSLTLYTFYLARQNREKLIKNRSFTIKPRSVQIFLNLPNEEDTGDPKRLIKDPITNAIEEINNEARNEHEGEPNFKIELEQGSLNKRIKNFLDDTNITVHLTGIYHDAFEKLDRKKKRKKAETNKK